MDTIGMRRVNRRRLAAGVAWAVPAITVATALPAYAASCDESCTSLNSKLSFGTALNQNGWSGSQAGTYKGDTAAVFLSSWSPAADTTNCSGSSRSCGSGGGSKTNIILFGGDPTGTLNNTTSPPSHYIDYKSANFCLHTGVSYSFSIPTIDKACVGNAVTVTALLINPLNAADTILIGSYTSTGPASQQSSISGTVSVTGSPSRNYYLRLRWTFSDATWTSCDWNDLGVGSPTVTCGGYNP